MARPRSTSGWLPGLILVVALFGMSIGCHAADAPCQLTWTSEVPLTGYFIDITSSGDLYVSDVPTRTVTRYSLDGVPIFRWSNDSANPWQFVRPFGITVSDQGILYVADFDQNVVLTFRDTGEFLGTIGSSGSGPGQMKQPYDVAVDAAGFLYVSDRGNSRIDKFNLSGEFVKSWGSFGFGPEQFANITCLSIDGPDQVVAGDQQGWIRRFTPEGVLLNRFDNGPPPTASIVVALGVTSTRGGSLIHAVDWDKSQVLSFGVDGAIFSKCGRVGHGTEFFFFPTDIDHVGDNLYLMDAGNNRLVVLGSGEVAVKPSTWSSIKLLFNRD